MCIQFLMKEKLSSAEVRIIFEEVISLQIKEQIISHAQWLDADPELEHISEFEEVSESFPDWPYLLKAYAYKFKDSASEIVSSFNISEEEKRVAWFNLIKLFAVLGSEHMSE